MTKKPPRCMSIIAENVQPNKMPVNEKENERNE